MSDTTIIPGERPGPSEPSAFLTPFAAANLPIGTPVFGVTADDDTVNAARANAIGTSYVLGLLARPVVDGDRALVQTRGPLTLTIAQWNVLTGLTGGLTRGPYFVSTAVAGGIQTAIPSSGGQFAAYIGYALSATTLILAPQPLFPIPEASA